MVLGCAGSPCSDAIVCSAVDCGAEDLVLEVDVVGDDGGSQMMGHVFEYLEHSVHVRVAVFSDN
jgi:hypothetical protein